MIRREKFVSRYSAVNNRSTLERDIVELEKLVDAELLKSVNIIGMINRDQMQLTDGEVVSAIIVNDSIHNDKNVLDNGTGRKGGTDNVEYAVWSDSITNTLGESVTDTPYYNKRLNTDVNGVLEILLPENTNKNAAKMLTDKYLGPLDASNLTEEDFNSVYGFWRKVPQFDGTYSDDPNAVQLVWDDEWQRFKMKFKLHQ